jgi:hypothetical protein
MEPPISGILEPAATRLKSTLAVKHPAVGVVVIGLAWSDDTFVDGVNDGESDLL